MKRFNFDDLFETMLKLIEGVIKMGIFLAIILICMMGIYLRFKHYTQ